MDVMNGRIIKYAGCRRLIGIEVAARKELTNDIVSDILD